MDQQITALAVFILGCILFAAVGSRLLRAAVERVMRRLHLRSLAGHHSVVPLTAYRPRRRPARKAFRPHPLALLILAACTFLAIAYVEEGQVLPPVRNTAVKPFSDYIGVRSQLVGPVTHVRDGDTIEVSGIPVRIANLDCAELGTKKGQAAKVYMIELIRRQTVICDLEGRRSYDRIVGVCGLRSGEDLGEILIREKICTRWKW